MLCRLPFVLAFISVLFVSTILAQWWGDMGPGTADHHTSGTILQQNGGNTMRNDGHNEYYSNHNAWNNPNAWNGMQWPAFPNFGRR
ncbi:hypothetical protein niasHT_009865 [Heterodera trifolii]|uniref:Gland protein n=1 Tax=Heterodera trifolii TaxID=157864 RepID=A0ABD2MD30_9BILA